jgi:hypothetical protein
MPQVHEAEDIPRQALSGRELSQYLLAEKRTRDTRRKPIAGPDLALSNPLSLPDCHADWYKLDESY